MKKLRTRETVGFLLLEALLYAGFLRFDFLGIDGDSLFSATALKYLAICLCFLTSLHWTWQGGSALQTAALAFTVAADTFLLLLDRWYIVGVGCFCVVQVLYFCRILRRNGGRSLWWLRALLLAAALGLLWYLDSFTVLNVLAAVYFTLFLGNVIQSLNLRGAGLFIAGLLLYLLCDVCVGIVNAPQFFAASLRELAALGMWLFYLPGQVLLTLSGRDKK